MYGIELDTSILDNKNDVITKIHVCNGHASAKSPYLSSLLSSSLHVIIAVPKYSDSVCNPSRQKSFRNGQSSNNVTKIDLIYKAIVITKQNTKLLL